MVYMILLKFEQMVEVTHKSLGMSKRGLRKILNIGSIRLWIRELLLPVKSWILLFNKEYKDNIIEFDGIKAGRKKLS